MINRLCKLPNKLSFFLFGARGTGKTTWIRQQLGSTQHLWFDLLDLALENRSSLKSRQHQESELMTFDPCAVSWRIRGASKRFVCPMIPVHSDSIRWNACTGKWGLSSYFPPDRIPSKPVRAPLTISSVFRRVQPY